MAFLLAPVYYGSAGSSHDFSVMISGIDPEFPQPGENVTIWLSAFSNSVYTGKVKVAVYLDKPSNLIDAREVVFSDSNITNVSISWHAVAGLHKIIACIDPDDIKEIREDNNIYSFDVEITANDIPQDDKGSSSEKIAVTNTTKPYDVSWKSSGSNAGTLSGTDFAYYNDFSSDPNLQGSNYNDYAKVEYNSAAERIDWVGRRETQRIDRYFTFSGVTMDEPYFECDFWATSYISALQKYGIINSFKLKSTNGKYIGFSHTMDSDHVGSGNRGIRGEFYDGTNTYTTDWILVSDETVYHIKVYVENGVGKIEVGSAVATVQLSGNFSGTYNSFHFEVGGVPSANDHNGASGWFDNLGVGAGGGNAYYNDFSSDPNLQGSNYNDYAKVEYNSAAERIDWVGRRETQRIDRYFTFSGVTMDEPYFECDFWATSYISALQKYGIINSFKLKSTNGKYIGFSHTMDSDHVGSGNRGIRGEFYDGTNTYTTDWILVSDETVYHIKVYVENGVGKIEVGSAVATVQLSGNFSGTYNSFHFEVGGVPSANDHNGASGWFDNLGVGAGSGGGGNDADGDGWSDYEETEKYFTDPNDPDTDDDGVIDSQDVDPLVDQKIKVTIKRIKASKYFYVWREGESWNRSYDSTTHSSWKIVSSDKASNGKYTRQQDRYGASDWAEWDFVVLSPDTYHFWIRCHRYYLASKNVHIQWIDSNGTVHDVKLKSDEMNKGEWYQDTADEWKWSYYGSLYLTAGSGTLKIFNKEGGNDYMCVDNILITNDPTYIPSGKGIEGRTDVKIGGINPQFDGAGKPDFYVKVTVNGVTKTSSVFWNQEDVLQDYSTGWIDVPDDQEEVSIVIKVYEKDTSSSMLCDISNTGDYCEIIYNLRNGTWYGDDYIGDGDSYGHTSGRSEGGIGYDCDVWFKVEQMDYDGDGITYWREVNVFKGSISPLIKNDRYAVIVGGGASCKVIQTNDVGSGIPPYRGTYLLYTGGYSWTDYTFSLELKSDEPPDADNEEIGVLFRYQNSDNYYRLRWEDRLTNDRLFLQKFVNGNCYDVATTYFNMEKGVWYNLRIKLSGSNIKVYIDGKLVFNVNDDSISSGTVALYCWRNRGAWFDDILVKDDNGHILLEEGFDLGRYDKWVAIDESGGSINANWTVTNISFDQEDFYIEPDFVYRVLTLAMHYDEENVYYLSVDKWRDADGDGDNDVDEIATADNIQYAIETWMASQSDGNDINLIYIFDHGNHTLGHGYFAVDSNRNGEIDRGRPDWIKDTTVDDWLPSYDSNGVNRLIFIIEACYIGHFIDELSHPNEKRIIIATSQSNNEAIGETGQDWPAFSHRFFKELADGETNITLAFYKAGYHVEQENYWSIHYKEQKPIMDDNGDGTGSRYTDISYTDTNKDGALGSKTGL